MTNLIHHPPIAFGEGLASRKNTTATQVYCHIHISSRDPIQGATPPERLINLALEAALWQLGLLGGEQLGLLISLAALTLYVNW